MNKKFIRFMSFLLCLFLLSACGQVVKHNEKLTKVGLLVPNTVNDQVWGTQGYKGLLKIQSSFQVDVYYKEHMNTRLVVERAVKELDQKGVNLIFGHGKEYAEFFNKLSKKYPQIHFVSFNGEAKNNNTTSVHVQSYSMGFFGGMVAGHMTKTNEVGIIAAYNWQPEIQGFYKGVMFENPKAHVKIKYVGNWDDERVALQILDKMVENNVDTVYPAGNGFNIPVMEQVKERGLYAIGYISDQSYLGDSTVLTSTIQRVDELYELIAIEYNLGELKPGIQSYDFKDDIISLGNFSTVVDKAFINKMKQNLQTYKETGKLPNYEPIDGGNEDASK